MNKAAVIATGTELVNGTIIDRNSQLISRALDDAGFIVAVHYTCPDDPSCLRSILDNVPGDVEIIIITGGLGPTNDDTTVESVAHYFSRNITTHQPSKKKMEKYFANRGITLDNFDMKMVTVIDDSTVMPNDVGLAPGFILDQVDRTIAVMPGPPLECSVMSGQYLIPYLKDKYSPVQQKKIIFRVCGMREAVADEKIKSLLEPWPHLTWSTTISLGLITISIYLDHSIDAQNLLNTIHGSFGDTVLMAGAASPEEEVMHHCRHNRLKLSVAESCTGGIIASRITALPGVSEIFRGGIVAYDNLIKTSLLDIDPADLTMHGAVSIETAEAMAMGCAKLFASDVAMAVTGIAGPGGGSEHKPVGTVCFGFYCNGEVTSFSMHLPGGRDVVQSMAATIAINNVRRLLLHHEK